jgi:hypothetical protein
MVLMRTVLAGDVTRQCHRTDEKQDLRAKKKGWLDQPKAVGLLGFDSGSSVEKRLEQILRGRPEEPDSGRNSFLKRNEEMLSQGSGALP